VDRCALLVDAGYVLADGAMAVHGTSQRGSVSWDYAGLVKLLTGLSRDRTGLPVLRCYWYEATVEGRRTPEHETLADLPGLKLRLGRIRPGRREGVETEMHRDLATLARNRAVSDAVIASAQEDLTEIVAEVQDLGMRVVIVHITVDGNWTISRPLRQECDDIVDVSGAHLRPFVDLIAGAEPTDRGEQYSNDSYQPRALEARGYETGGYQRRGLANGHGIGIGAVTHQGLPAAALPAPPTIYTAPVVEEYQRSAQPAGPGARNPDSVSAGSMDHDSAGAMGSGAMGPDPAGSMGPDSAGQGSMGTGPMGTGPMGTGPMGTGPMGSASLVPSPPAPPPPPALPGPAAMVPPAQASPPPAVPPPAAGPAAQAGPPAQVGSSYQAAPPAQVGSSYQAGPVHQFDHGARAAEQVVPQGGHAISPGQPGEQEADAARNSLRAHDAPGSGRPGAHASQPPMAQPPMAQAPARRAPLPSPMPQSPGPGNVPFGPGQGEYRSPGPAGPRSGLPVREGTVREGPGPRDGMSRDGMAVPGTEAGRPAGPAAARFADVSVPAQPASAPSGPAQQMPPQPMPGQQMPARQMSSQQMSSQQMPGQQYPPAPQGQFSGNGPAQMPPYQQFHGPQPGQQPASGPGSGYPTPQHEQGPYSEPQPAHASASQPMTVSLADAVQAAHAEGFGFGDAVARDAPALWLEAVLARKPRMPSDLEARLLQGSALPIDSLLHDEVRHALRRGFWDALERSRR
jgi:NYN domain